MRTAAPDILISDIGMPDVDGYEFLKQIRSLDSARGGKVPAIALTAFASREDEAKSHAAGFSVHISKPIAPEDLDGDRSESHREESAIPAAPSDLSDGRRYPAAADARSEPSIGLWSRRQNRNNRTNSENGRLGRHDPRHRQCLSRALGRTGF